MVSKKILITGGAGFIGSNLARRLLSEENYEITILDNFSEQVHGSNLKISEKYYYLANNTRLIHADIRDQSALEKIIGDHEIVVHLAAETGTGQSMYQISQYVQVNEQGTATLLDTILKKSSNIEKIILASSRAIYGEGKYECRKHGVVYPKHRDVEDMKKNDFSVKCPVCNQSVLVVPTDENSLIHPQSIYGITKQNQEQLLFTFSQTHNIPAIALRFQNVYGPGQSLSNSYTGIMSIFSNRCMLGEEINVFEDGNESRDFIFIDDAVESILLAIRKKLKVTEQCGYNVGSGKRYTILEIAQKLKEIYQSDLKISVSGMFRKGDIRHSLADIRKIKKELQFKPKIELSEGLKEYTKWVSQQNVTEGNYENTINEMKSNKILGQTETKPS
jgi:dTDP-L-rhamnose 4-epimerase